MYSLSASTMFNQMFANYVQVGRHPQMESSFINFYSYLQNARPFLFFLCVRLCLVQIQVLGKSVEPVEQSRWVA